MTAQTLPFTRLDAPPCAGTGDATLDAPPAVVLEGVTKVFTEGDTSHTVLEDITLTLPAGRFIVILGRSGSGKSTLLNLIAGIDDPSRGHITVAGVPITRLAERERTIFRRDHIGFVYQFFNLIPTLSVRDNVALPLELAGRASTARAAADALLAEVDLLDRADSYPDRLSGGEQQRVAIARALAAAPPIVLADEPTGNLDLETGTRVLALLRRLVGDRGRTLIMATHSRAVAAAADVVLRVEGTGLVPVQPGLLTDAAW
ncbi:MAG: ABC transporter ATP-binding protein [Ardenticatenales bacterium]|nr:ABC transporter ATP-binding protein [Ardenticatenales bacterium]